MSPIKRVGAVLLVYAVYYSTRIIRKQLYFSNTRLKQILLLKQGDLNHYRRLDYKPNVKELDAFLTEKIPFYRLLDTNESIVFRNRLLLLLRTKWFVGRQGIDINNEMILTFGALMIQVTFGFNNFLFPHFHRVAIFPDIFYSRLFERYVKGLTVYHTGIILVSWPHLEHGIDNESDKINLGLHELAHALYLDYFEHRNMLNGFDRWTTKALQVFKEMQLNSKDFFLREYAATNIHEFWAVCVEHYFEAPLEFRERLPELYKEMCRILKQDVAARHDRFPSSYISTEKTA
ncbi:MAG: zinc-dependent peptidase [Bacteroidia bacterium]